MSANHYENFPVASFLLPKHLRRAVLNIYRFARSADDIADEGDASNAQRLQALQAYRDALQACNAPCVQRPIALDPALDAIFTPLGQTIADHELPLKPFEDLLSAFEQDISQKRYANQAALDHYCERSANPVGRLMLHLYGAIAEDMLAWSDAICTALQRLNFLQDVAIDWQKDRIYLPQQALKRFGVTEEAIANGEVNAAWKALMQDQVTACRGLLHFGQPLGRRLPGRIGLELRLIVQGGLRILEKIEHVDFDVFERRPTLGVYDWTLMLARALRT
ncbi:MAG: squalene synthase HpnC [Alcaligenaceae bacterium]|nr:MAG: squalene synthase HpnC [Alcaligenaceae bacterium]